MFSFINCISFFSFPFQAIGEEVVRKKEEGEGEEGQYALSPHAPPPLPRLAVVPFCMWCFFFCEEWKMWGKKMKYPPLLLFNAILLVVTFCS